MRFGYGLLTAQRPPNESRTYAQLYRDTVEYAVEAERAGLDSVWTSEHHFLDEYSHCSASEVFLTALAAKTERIRVGFGIRQVIPNYNHPARTAEGLATLDIIANGRVDFGIGEGATRLELGGFGIKAKEKRAMALEAATLIVSRLVQAIHIGGWGFCTGLGRTLRHGMEKYLPVKPG